MQLLNLNKVFGPLSVSVGVAFVNGALAVSVGANVSEDAVLRGVQKLLPKNATIQEISNVVIATIEKASAAL